MDWSAQSPDLNPTENLWTIIKQRVMALKPNTRKQLGTFGGRHRAEVEANREGSMRKTCGLYVMTVCRSIFTKRISNQALSEI